MTACIVLSVGPLVAAGPKPDTQTESHDSETDSLDGELELFDSNLEGADSEIEEVDILEEGQLEKLESLPRDDANDEDEDQVEAASAPPPNNQCSNCASISPGVPFGFWTTKGTADGSSTCDAGASPDVWYCFTPVCSGVITINTCGSFYDTILSVHTGCPGTTGNQVSCNDDQVGGPAGCGPTDSYINMNVTGGVNYRIRVAGFAGASGNFLLSLTYSAVLTPTNNLCTAAIPVPSTPATLHGTTLPPATASPANTMFPAPFWPSTPDVWYTFTPQCSGPVTIDTCGPPCNGLLSQYDTVLSAYTGTCNLMNQVPGAFNDDMGAGACPSNGLASRITFNAIGGVIYRIRVSGYAGATGNFVLHVNQTLVPPSNNSCASAITLPLGGSGGVIGFSTCGATTDGPAACSANQDIWYKWQAPTGCSAPVTMHTCGSQYDTYLAVYTGSCGGLMAQVPNTCVDDTGFSPPNPCPNSLNSWVQFTPIPGTWYYIRVGGFQASAGAGKLTIVGPNPSTGTCPPTSGVPNAFGRAFMVNGPSNNTPWAWCLSSPCCMNVQNLNVSGVPVGANSPIALAQAFAASIDGTCSGSPNDPLIAKAISGQPIFKVTSRCGANAPMILSVGAAGTPCAAQCVVADYNGVVNPDPIPTSGACSFNPEIVEIPLAGTDCNGNGEDDFIDLLEGTSFDDDGDGMPDECVAVGCGTCRLYGDIAPGYCSVDVDDILLVLDGFVSGEHPEADIAPCEPNAVVDVDDIAAVLDAFVGVSACPDPCPPGACLTEMGCLDAFNPGGMSETDCAISSGSYCGDYSYCGDPGCP